MREIRKIKSIEVRRKEVATRVVRVKDNNINRISFLYFLLQE